MIQYWVPATALRMNPLSSKPELPPLPHPTRVKAPGEPVNTSTAIGPLLALGSNATCSLATGVNVYQTLWAWLNEHADESVEESHVACEMSNTSLKGSCAIIVALPMTSFDGAAAAAGAAPARMSGTIATRTVASRTGSRPKIFILRITQLLCCEWARHRPGAQC